MLPHSEPVLTLNPAESRHDQPCIGLVSNPNSRRNRSQLSAVSELVASRSNIHHRITGKPDDISPALEEFASLGVDVLAINGGDGTVARVLSELFNHSQFTLMPQLMLLPGGTTNMNVADVGIPGKLKHAVQKMTGWADGKAPQPQIRRRTILRVEHAARPLPDWGMFFGTGIITRGIDYCHNHVHTLGLTDEIGPGLVVLRTLWGTLRKDPRFTTPVSARITVGASSSHDHEVVLLLVTSLQRLFLGMRPWWGSEDGNLHCSWIQQPHRRLLRVFPSLLRGKPHRFVTEGNGYFSHNADSIQLWMDGSYTVDGEIYPADSNKGPVTISSSPALEFLRL